MGTVVTYNGTQYTVPAYQDTGYAQGNGNLSQYLVALATGALTLAGGSFVLTADVNFGPSFGLVSLYYKTRTANIASAGQFRLANTDIINWRNAGNSADVSLAVNASNLLTWAGAALAQSAGTGITLSAAGVISITAPVSIALGGTNATGALSNNRVMKSSAGTIIEAAAITANRAVTSDSNGIPVASATTDTEVGYVSGVTSALQTQLNNIALGTVGRNRIINGDMRISQQAAGALVAVNTNADFWPVDMLRCGAQVADGVFTAQQLSTTPPAGFTNYVHFVTTTADASIGAAQLYAATIAIEGNNCRDLLYGTASAKTITLSFWVKSSLTGAFSGALSNSATDRSYPFSYTINSAATWEQKTITITGDLTGTWLTDTGIGIRVYFDLGSGTSRRATANSWAAGSNITGVTGAVSLIATNAATLDLTGIQFELGSTATQFEFRPMATELAMCQRYYVKLGGSTSTDPISLAHAISATVAYCLRPFPVVMRAAPTGTVNNPTNFTTGNAAGGTINCTALTFSSASTSMVQLNATVAAGLVAGNASNLLSGTSNATIDVSAQI